MNKSFFSSGLFAMIVGTFCFSVGSAFIKLAGARLPAMEVVFARSLFMLFYCYLLTRRAGVRITGNNKPFLFMRGLLGFGAYCCIFYAIIHMPLADALVIAYSFPLIVPLWAALFLGEPLEGRVLFCSLVGAIGLVFVTRPGFLFGASAELAPWALWAALGAATLSSFSVICIRKLTATEHPLVIVMYAGATSVIGAPLLDGWNWLVPTRKEFGILLGVGLFMSVGQQFLTTAFSRSSAARTSVLFYLEVVFAALLGYLCFAEIPDMLTLFGGGLIISSAVMLGLKSRK